MVFPKDQFGAMFAIGFRAEMRRGVFVVPGVVLHQSSPRLSSELYD